MAISKSEIQLLADKTSDPYYMLMWSDGIRSILEREDEYVDMYPHAALSSNEHKENCKLYGVYLDNLDARYKEAMQTIFQITDLSTNKIVECNVTLLEKEFDDGYSVGERDTEPELLKIVNDAWNEVEADNILGKITSANWNDNALYLSYDRGVAYLKTKYEVKITNQELLNEFISKNIPYDLSNLSK